MGIFEDLEGRIQRLEKVRDDIDHLEQDARLGRLVRSMVDGNCLLRTTVNGAEVWKAYQDVEGISFIGQVVESNLPHEALSKLTKED